MIDMTTQEQEPKPETPKIDPKVQAFWNELTEEASNNYNEGFKNIIRSDEYEYNGQTYHFEMLNHKKVGELKRLQKEDINEDEDWDKYVDNYRKRACLLIQEMTPEKFDNADFFVIENLVTAWSIRATKGFRNLLKSV